MTTPVDIDDLDRKHALAVGASVRDPVEFRPVQDGDGASSYAAFAVAVYNAYPRLVAELRALRALRAERHTHDDLRRAGIANHDDGRKCGLCGGDVPSGFRHEHGQGICHRLLAEPAAPDADLRALRESARALGPPEPEIVASCELSGLQLFFVKDSNRPMHVVARNWNEALAAWHRKIREENDVPAKEAVEGPLGIEHVCNAQDLLLTCGLMGSPTRAPRTTAHDESRVLP